MGVRSSAARKIARYVLSPPLYEFFREGELTPKALIDGMHVPYVDKFIASI